MHGGPLELVDPDSFSARNAFRYPILNGYTPKTEKATWLAELCTAHGIEANAHPLQLTDYTNSFPEPPRIDLALVSVDTLDELCHGF